MNQFWTKEEDEKLMQLLSGMEKDVKGGLGVGRPGEAYRFLMRHFPTRNLQSLYNRVTKLKSGKPIKYEERRVGYTRWTTEEIEKLADIVKQLPKRSNGALRRGGLKILCDAFPDKTPDGVSRKLERLSTLLQEKRQFNYEPWTEEEVAKLRETYAQDKWFLDLQKTFPNRVQGDIVAKAMELGLTRKRLKVVPFHLTSEERALAAGLILGDGYITLSTREGGGKRGPTWGGGWGAHCGFVNTEKEMVDWFVERIPRGTVNVADRRGEESKIPIKKICYHWKLADKPTLAYFLEMIYPYLIGVKKEKARQILEKLIPVIANDIAESYLEKKAS